MESSGEVNFTSEAQERLFALGNIRQCPMAELLGAEFVHSGLSEAGVCDTARPDPKYGTCGDCKGRLERRSAEFGAPGR